MDGYILVPHEKYLTSCSRNLGTLDLNLMSNILPFSQSPAETNIIHQPRPMSPRASPVWNNPQDAGISPSCPDSRSIAALLPQIYNSALDNILTQQFVSIPSGLIEPHRPKLTIHRHLHIQLHLRHQPRTIVRPLLPLTLPLIGHNRPNLSSISPIHPLVVIASQLSQPELSKRRSDTN
ncbi:uncharacterized protein QC763_705620 [Podospora pseudopauciseta]|uniref:Uncharacterized protein n=1 Tax=Podospora pseudopauciseta TaxID=2093780 RepID=A0ABR0H108_9PEZI|nr:hypothetical protein QC763_705620 [Podospora pseudopauciseta]